MSQATRTSDRGQSGRQEQRKTGMQHQDKSSAEDAAGDLYDVMSDVTESLTRYCNSRPRMAAAAVFALGFFVGWKLKPW